MVFSKPLPPVYLLLSLVAMILLDAYAPWWRWHESKALAALGGGLSVFGLALVLWGARLFLSHETAIKPFQESSALVTSGPYRFTRNPMYVGMSIVLLGIGIILGSLTPFCAIPFFVVVIQTKFIPIEEAMLLERFGPEYEAFKRRTPRWLLR